MLENIFDIIKSIMKVLTKNHSYVGNIATSLESLNIEKSTRVHRR